MSCVPQRIRHKIPSFKLWHVSLLMANYMWPHLPKTPINKDSPQSYKRDLETLRGLKVLLEPNSKASKNLKNFTFESEKYSKQIHSSHPSRSKSSLKSNSKASINTKKLQISEALWIQASKAPRNLHYKSSKTKNIQITFIQIILPSLKVLLESSFKTSKNFKDFDPMKFQRIRALKPWKTSNTNLWRSRPSIEASKTLSCCCG